MSELHSPVSPPVTSVEKAGPGKPNPDIVNYYNERAEKSRQRNRGLQEIVRGLIETTLGEEVLAELVVLDETGHRDNAETAKNFGRVMIDLIHQFEEVVDSISSVKVIDDYLPGIDGQVLPDQFLSLPLIGNDFETFFIVKLQDILSARVMALAKQAEDEAFAELFNSGLSFNQAREVVSKVFRKYAFSQDKIDEIFTIRLGPIIRSMIDLQEKYQTGQQ